MKKFRFLALQVRCFLQVQQEWFPALQIQLSQQVAQV